MSEDSVNILGLIESAGKNIEISDLDSFLATLSKYERLMDKFISIYNRLDRSGVIPVVLRIIGKKAEVDVDKPINNPLIVIASSATHKAFFEMMNDLNEKDVRAIHEQILLSKAMMEINNHAPQSKSPSGDSRQHRQGVNKEELGGEKKE
ncbi:hypothetical protein DRN58_09275 [Thermococci archaeon]|nr:MAG: hypothetical protein DRN58_09275 [Thermococci archaeon]